MSRARRENRRQATGFRGLRVIVGIAVAVLATPSIRAQGYDDTFEMRSKLKVEFQYTDYSEYEYPEPILFNYGVTPYVQNQPYIVNFPEVRGLIKYSRLVGERTALSFKYQYSSLREDVSVHYLEGKVTRTLSEPLVGLLSFSYLNDTRGFGAVQGGAGLMWEPHVLTTLSADGQYYYRNPSATPVGGQMASINLRLKVRRVLTLSTAAFAEYMYYDAHGDFISFHSHAIAVWLSQFLPTQTAVHVTARLYTNTAGIDSFAPSLEVAQYLNWATVLWLRFRYYQNRSENVSFGEEGVIIPNGLISRAASVQVNRDFRSDLLVYAKYRFYWSNLGISMHTYMVGTVWSF